MKPGDYFMNGKFKATHRVIASRGMSFPVQFVARIEKVVHYIDDKGTLMSCHVSEIVPLEEK